MVDMAFLLLTFFVMTSNMHKDNTMLAVVFPEPGENHTPVSKEKILTLIPAENDRLYYYRGMGEEGLIPVQYGSDGLRELIRKHLRHDGTIRCQGNETQGCWDPIVVIKPRKKARYGNLVDVLDELKITGVTKYAVTDFSKEDSIIWHVSNP